MINIKSFKIRCSKRRLTGLLLCFFLFTPVPSTKAKERSDADKILVIGTSTIHGKNLAQAKKAALSQALMKGMEDYLVRRLGHEGMVNNFQRLAQEIIPGAREVIENFHILAENQDKASYKVLVGLRINKQVVDEKLRKIGLVMMEGPPIKVLFMVLESREGQLSYWWKDPEEPSAMSAVEVALHNAFEERGYNPVNQRQSIPETEFSEDMRSADLTDENVLTWGRLFSAEVVIYGRTEITDTTEISMTLKAVAVNRGGLICQGMHIEPIESDSEGHAQPSEAFEKLANYLASKLTPAIVQTAGHKRQQIHMLDVTLTGLKTYKQFIDFRDFLRKNLPGVRSIAQTRVKKGAISVEIGFDGNENQFLERVLNHDSLPFSLDFNRDENGKIVFEVE